MDKKPNYQYIFDLLDFADEIFDMISPENDSYTNSQYFTWLIYVEDILDVGGRAFVAKQAQEAGLDGNEAMTVATKRMDQLRLNIKSIFNDDSYGLQQSAKRSADKIMRDWVR